MKDERLRPAPRAFGSGHLRYGHGRHIKILLGAIFFPLPLLITIVGNIQLDGWSIGTALALLAVVGTSVSLVLFLVFPLRCWWGLRVALAIFVLGCMAWTARELLVPRESGPPVPWYAWIIALVLILGGAYLVFRPVPRLAKEELQREFLLREHLPGSGSGWLMLGVLVLAGLAMLVITVRTLLL